MKGDWQTAKSVLSRIVGEDGPFLLLTLDYSRTQLEWELEKTEEYIEQLKEYPDPCFELVGLDHNYENAEMTGNPRRIGHHQGLFRAYKRKYGSFWGRPDDFRKAQIMAADRRSARDKAWYAHPTRARKTELESQPQSRPQPQQVDIAEGLRVLERVQTEARPQPQSPQPDIDQDSPC
jgi:hypothetical protein